MADAPYSTPGARSIRIPHIPADLIRLLDAALADHRTAPPQRHSPEELETMRGHLEWATEKYGPDHPLTLRCTLIIALEYARAEVML